MAVLAQTRVDEVVATTTPPALTDPSFEAQIAAYLKSTEEWAPPDRPQPFERHLIRKRQRARAFQPDESP
jgi:hypothetical protein